MKRAIACIVAALLLAFMAFCVIVAAVALGPGKSLILVAVVVIIPPLYDWAIKNAFGRTK